MWLAFVISPLLYPVKSQPCSNVAIMLLLCCQYLVSVTPGNVTAAFDSRDWRLVLCSIILYWQEDLCIQYTAVIFGLTKICMFLKFWNPISLKLLTILLLIIVNYCRKDLKLSFKKCLKLIIAKSLEHIIYASTLSQVQPNV